MKAFLLGIILLAALSVATDMIAHSEADLTTQLRETLSQHHWDDSSAQQIAAALPEPRKASLAAVVRIIQDEIRDGEMNDILVARCTHVLKAASDEDGIIAAFAANMERIPAKHDGIATSALSACRDSRAVEMIAAQARRRLKELGELLPQLRPPGLLTDEQSKMYSDISISLSRALKALARSANDSGKTVARQLRDEYVRMFDRSPWQKCILQDLATELDPLLRDGPQSDRPRSGGPIAAPTAASKQLQPSKAEKPAKMAPSEAKAPNSSGMMLIAGVVVALVLFAALVWFVWKK